MDQWVLIAASQLRNVWSHIPEGPDLGPPKIAAGVPGKLLGGGGRTLDFFFSKVSIF